MSKPPRISTVTPAYNAANCIAPTLESILAQTYPPHEIIVVDDGSKDNTCDIVRSFGDRVTLISQENAGPAAARNTGIRAATSDWVALVDSDDTWLPEKLEKQAPLCKDGVGLVRSHITNPVMPQLFREVTFEELWITNQVGTSTVVLSKKVWEELDGFQEDRAFIGAEDYNYWLRVAHAGYKIESVFEGLVNYTPAPNSLSQRTEKVVLAELLNLDTLAEQLNLPKDKVAKKRAEILEEYGREFFWLRNLRSARKYYGQLCRQRPSVSAVAHWLATFLPPSLLDMKRRKKKVAAA